MKEIGLASIRNDFLPVQERSIVMQKVLWVIVLSVTFLGGCAVVKSLILPDDSEMGESQRFWDQTSDNPYR